MRMLRIRSTDWILIRDIIISVILALIVSTSGHWLHDYFASKTIETVELETVGVYG